MVKLARVVSSDLTAPSANRTLSMTFGRPAAIPDDYVKLDLPVKHDFEASSSFVDEETSTISVAFFNSTM